MEYAELLCVDDNPESAERDESPESNEEIDDREEIVEASVEEVVSETPSNAESVSKPVVFERPKSAVAVSPEPVVLLVVLFSLFLLVDALVFSELESEGIETDGIDGEDISGMEIDGILVCVKTVPIPMIAIKPTIKRNFIVLASLQVRKTFINYFQSGSELRNCFFQPGFFFFKPSFNIHFL